MSDGNWNFEGELSFPLQCSRTMEYHRIVDWSFAKSLSEKEQMKLWVETWRHAGPELERLKRAELRALSEEDAFDQAEVLAESVTDVVWIDSGRSKASGLVEQQRLFRKLRSSVS
jgi:uncharacterized protein involved in type VI secretion and phage assembly